MSEQRIDLNQILSMLDSNDMFENIQKLGMLMGSPEKGNDIKKMMEGFLTDNNMRINQASASMQHTDPGINLLLALKPFLSERKGKHLDKYLKTMNTAFFLQQLNQAQQKSFESK